MSIKLFIAGDSTAAPKLPEKRPESGWGEHLQPLFNNKITVCNHAVNGRSTKSFIDEGRLSEIEAQLQKGDWLIIQFGHNDEKKEDPLRCTLPWTSYMENLKVFINSAMKKGAYPLVLSSVTRRRFENGSLSAYTVGKYPKAAIELAKQEQICFIDMYSASWNLVNGLGEKQSADLFLHLEKNENENYPEGVEDNTHLNYTGAKEIAGLFARKLKESSCPLKEYLL